MFCLVVALTLSADLVRAPVGVAAISRRPGVEKVAPRVVSRLGELLISEGVADALDASTTAQRLKKAGTVEASTCAGGQQCALKLAAALGPHAVLIAIDVSKFGASLDIRIEALPSDGDSPIATADVSVDAVKWKELSSASLLAFVQDLKAKLVITEPPPLPPTDPPKEIVLEPRRLSPPAPAAAPKLRGVGITLVAVSGLAAVVSAIVLGLALSDQATFNASLLMPGGPSSLSPMEGRQLAELVNTKLTVALITGLIAVVAGGASVPFFLSPAAPPTPEDDGR